MEVPTELIDRIDAAAADELLSRSAEVRGLNTAYAGAGMNADARVARSYQGKQPMKFEPGNKLSTGRARGSRNRLANFVFQDVLQFWTDPTADGKTTKGKAALLTMWRERPHEFVKAVFAIMPKEFLFESVVTELADDELDRMIEIFREQQRLAQEQPLKMIEIRQPENAR